MARLCLGLTASAALAVNGLGSAQAAEGQVLGAGSPDAVAGSYIVTLHGTPSKAPGTQSAVGATAGDLAQRYGGDVSRVYSAALRGFSVRMSEQQARRLAADPAVRSVEQNATAKLVETWGLDRVDQRDLPLSDSYTAPNDGSGVTAYVVDTGMDLDHPDYGGRASSGYDFIDNDNDASDCQGHGTHVGGTVGSKTWGVAKNVKLVAVRVLGCDGRGTWDQIIGGIDWVTEHAPEAAVGNMSLGGQRSTTVNDAVSNSIRAGVAWAVAAGNEGQDACNVSPASVPEALTVAASDNQDRRSIWNSTQSSNYGRCVDLFAPGSNITSTRNGGGTQQMGGTSMATPHVAGALALEIHGKPNGSVADANAAVVNTATPDKISDIKGSPNKLLYVNELGGGGGEPGDPTASFTADCAGTLNCRFDGSGSSDPDGSIASYAWDFGDGKTGEGATPSHSYATAGQYTVKLTVTDNEGKTGTVSKKVSAGAPAGESPTAQFTANCSWANCTFDGTRSTDPDGDIASYAWDFGDGKTGTGATATHNYPNRQANHTAKLTVTDRAGNSHSTSKTVQCWSFGSQAFCFGQ
ncbi:PKD domain-containing protein [Amycolatopsis suaedae]|uniref:PKD domain-containing protein n=1 Tax=Amycolatopsis suaedae TaxID=2510978 RepID=A0A4Q7J8H1_9PSEU|nr:PKD domain-containing protein [Amycolatopsis suaedae]RZQ63507.1 PKD domain-containing protein [Amycolatopsis suaedae]